MQFRLTYEGPLSSAAYASADHKHEIRKAFHKQLKRFWAYHPFFKTNKVWVYNPPRADLNPDGSSPDSRQQQLANLFSRNNYRFVPTACADLCVYCSLDILFLRPEPPGAVWSSGDIDNRIKTIVDTLQMPQQAQDLGKYLKPDEEEEPFFVLMENDKLLTKLSVETDMLLEPIGKYPSKTDARLVITVNLAPYQSIWGNMGV